MENIKNSIAFKILNGKDFKSKCIKLALVLVLMFLTFINDAFGYVAFAFCMVYIVFEFSADSMLWLILMGVFVPYISVTLLQILMWGLIVVLGIQFVRDIITKRIDCKNWRFITLTALLIALILLVMLPLATTYSFGAQFNRLTLFIVLWLGIFYVKQINIKHLLILFASSIGVLCILFVIAKALGGGNGIIIEQSYSKGIVERFSPFNIDPNFTGAILICAITSWYLAYRKGHLNKYVYFGGLLVLGCFVLMTISKATILIILLFGVYIVIENIVVTIKTKNAKHLLELLYYLGVVLLACAICWKYIDAMYQRIVHPATGWWEGNDTNNSASSITTGRSDLWIGYLKAIFSDWRILLFGSGVKSGYVEGLIHAHSMPIEYLYKYGILVFIILLAIFVVGALPYIKRAKVYNFVPLILITGIFCSIGSVSIKYVYVFVLTFLTLCWNGIYDAKVKTSTSEEPLVNATTSSEGSTLNETKIGTEPAINATKISEE